MEIQHRIAFSNHDGIDDQLQKSGINPKKSPLPGNNYILSFDVSETHPAWVKISELIKEKGASDAYDTFFTDEEIRKAEWSRLYPVYENGYPQPEKNHGWKKIVYEQFCPDCGIGIQQVTPFHIKQEPRLGKNNFMSLYWTYNLFTTPQVFQKLKQNGIESSYEEWPVILHKTQTPSQVISQIYVLKVSKPGLSVEDQQKPETCSSCGITKYAFHKRGLLKMQRTAIDPSVDIQMTYEWFGSGRHGGFREDLHPPKGSLILFWMRNGRVSA